MSASLTKGGLYIVCVHAIEAIDKNDMSWQKFARWSETATSAYSFYC